MAKVLGRGEGAARYVARGSVMLFKVLAEQDDGDFSLMERTLPPGWRRPPAGAGVVYRGDGAGRHDLRGHTDRRIRRWNDPEAPAGMGTAVTTTTADPIPAASATAARASVGTARAPGWCRLTLPFAPLVRRKRPARAT